MKHGYLSLSGKNNLKSNNRRNMFFIIVFLVKYDKEERMCKLILKYRKKNNDVSSFGMSSPLFSNINFLFL